MHRPLPAARPSRRADPRGSSALFQVYTTWFQVWAELLRLRDSGLIRALGVSNFGKGQLEGLRRSGLELPEVNQVEIHCSPAFKSLKTLGNTGWRPLPELCAYHWRHGIVTMCMAPLARGEMFEKTAVAEVAKELRQSEAAVAVRWCLQMGYVAIPRCQGGETSRVGARSVQPSRIVENQAMGFRLTDAHMERSHTSQ